MLERRIEDIAKKPKEESYQTLMKILDKAFPLASAPLLRPLVMRILTKIDNIPEEHLNALVEGKDLSGNPFLVFSQFHIVNFLLLHAYIFRFCTLQICPTRSQKTYLVI